MAEEISQYTQEKYDRAYWLVGRFMSGWAHLESALNDCVGKLLKMETIEATVATVNMMLRPKVHIVKAMIRFECGESEWGKTAVKDIERIAGH